MGAFEDFIQDELPLRQVVVKASGNPSTEPGYIAAIGTYYLNTDNNFKRYEKTGSGNTDWSATPTSNSTGGVETDSIVFSGTTEITSLKIPSVSGTQILDTFNVDDFRSAKYTINAVGGDTFHCSELLILATDNEVVLTQYGVLGDSSAIRIEASVVNNIVSLSGITTIELDVSLYRFALS